MDNREIAHMWAHQTTDRAKGSNFYFEGDTIYSYGSHFPIARHYKGAILFTSQGYSNTTAKHKGYVRSAISHREVFTVENPANDPCKADVQGYKERIDKLALDAARARNVDTALQFLNAEIAEANKFCQRFRFKTRFAMPSGEAMAKLKEKAKASAAKERKAKAEKQAKLEAELAETVAKWLAGERVTIPYNYGHVLLRIANSGNEQDGGMVMETSKNARVPITEAERAFQFCLKMRDKGWHRNGDTFKVGDYQLDAVNEFGVIAGCHRVAWAEIERFAKAQGWL